MAFNRTAYFNAIQARFAGCRFVGTDPDRFDVEYRGEVIATVRDADMFEIPAAEFAQSIAVPTKPAPPVAKIEDRPVAPVPQIAKKTRGRPRKSPFPPSPTLTLGSTDTEEGNVNASE